MPIEKYEARVRIVQRTLVYNFRHRPGECRIWLCRLDPLSEWKTIEIHNFELHWNRFAGKLLKVSNREQSQIVYHDLSAALWPDIRRVIRQTSYSAHSTLSDSNSTAMVSNNIGQSGSITAERPITAWRWFSIWKVGGLRSDWTVLLLLLLCSSQCFLDCTFKYYCNRMTVWALLWFNKSIMERMRQERIVNYDFYMGLCSRTTLTRSHHVRSSVWDDPQSFCPLWNKAILSFYPFFAEMT